MTERSFQDAVQLLKERMTGRWDGMETDGRAEMVDILKDGLGYDSTKANDLIDAMIESGTLRYHGATAEAAALPVPPIGTGGSEAGAVPLPIAPGAGYWQIGDGAGESIGRKGQVDPT